MDRAPGFSVRLKLTLSYAGFLMLAGLLLLAAVWVFLLRGVPASRLVPKLSNFPLALDPHNFGPAAFGSAAVAVLAFLLVFGLVGGWFLAGRMLAPLDRITDATRIATTGSLVHRIRLIRCGLVQLRPCHRAAPILAGHQSDDGFVVLDALAGRVSGRMSADLLVEHCQHRSSVHRSAEPKGARPRFRPTRRSPRALRVLTPNGAGPCGAARSAPRLPARTKLASAAFASWRYRVARKSNGSGEAGAAIAMRATAAGTPALIRRRTIVFSVPTG
jgi:hypothetical protein